MNNENHEEKVVYVPVEAPKVDAAMIVRLMVFVVALLNAVAAIFGKELNLVVDQELWYNVVSAALVIGSSIWVAWRNNNITKKARIRDKVAKQVVKDQE